MSSSQPQPASIMLARTIISGLIAYGVRDFVYSPGSRSAPLAYALAEAETHHPIRIRIRLDERGAAFTAIGLSRAGHTSQEAAGGGEAGQGCPRPVVLIGTSGGAIAEYHAGIAEASHSELPLIVLSADRPFEMRAVGASQTTEQAGIFASHCRNVWDIPADQKPDHRLVALVGRAVACANGTLGTRPGPVHLNLALRDPLAPTSWPPSDLPIEVTATSVIPTRHRPTPWEEVVDPGLHTVIVAGDGAPSQVAHWAEKARIPLLAEPTSGGAHSQAWIPFQQALLHADCPLYPRIEQVIVAGRPTLSRPVSALLARDDIRLIVVGDHHEWVDVAGRAATVVRNLTAPNADHQHCIDWLNTWHDHAAQMGDAIDDIVACDELSMASAADLIWRAPTGALVLGASNTIRAFDLLIQHPPCAPILSNRGLAGIDGTIATAFGVAWGSGKPVRAVMGDLSFFHDASSLAITGDEDAPNAQIVVFDDHGGGIFDSLEYSAAHLSELYPRWFDTAQRVSIKNIAHAYGARYHRVETLDELHKLLDQPICGVSIVHIPIERPTALFQQIKRSAIHALREED